MTPSAFGTDEIPTTGMPIPRMPDPSEMPLEGLWQSFAIFKQDQMIPMGYPQNIRRLFHPQDNDHGAIVALCNAARVSVAAAMGGDWDDDDAVEEMFHKAQDGEHIACTLKLNSTIRDLTGADQAIVVDGLVTILRTPESALFVLDPVFAAETRAKIDLAA